ncbi:DUF1707 SHOCT-like domain-containing protein [Marinitenerispora sediminis]|uniref:DUF1707 domain-containing protein n=1 Tax=Marinitenerispora sediminis TaxID=1931232 RepID=A0A368T0T9_9ACTN|nr:DUF1707 domain-containing protein [Marinitenerispora sediminis]RCV52774.1 hypothetical protein DEF24_21545 [Marinitenerispora sediminis]RCV55597.1 hypothetical protein DEF28_05715 [Marinitenerispora sediminis]RCV61925.1 hypothetical protein DEF23_01155 [Marinitenerispora sediminis]
MTAQPPEPSPRPAPSGQFRASHDDREAVVERLRDAAAEGRIDLDELDSRLEQALTSKTHAELAALTADLPKPHSSASQPPLVLRGGLHGASRGPGRWEVPGHVIAHGGMGGVKLDFTRVECNLPEVTVEAYGEAAGVTIVLPDGWAADTSGMDPGLGGLTDKTTPDRRPGTPLIRLTGSGGMAGVVIRHPNRWERRRLERHPRQG